MKLLGDAFRVEKNVGKIVHLKKSTPLNIRNTEGAFLALTDGRLMYIYSCFGSSPEDWGECAINVCWSCDNGNTWEKDEQLFCMKDEGLENSDPENPQNIMSVSLIRLNNGDIGLFYVVRKRGVTDSYLCMRRSCDEGKTWSDSICCTPGGGYIGVCNDRVIKLSTGRLLVPAALKRKVYFFISDDDGRTWRESKERCSIQVSWSVGLQEPGVLELENGDVWCFNRTDLGSQYEMFSKDGGDTWTIPQPSQHFKSPCSPMVAKRTPHGTIVAVWNPVPYTWQENHPWYVSNLSQKRSPLVIAESKDEGKTWSTFQILEAIEDGFGGAVEYPALYCMNDFVLISYNVTSDFDGCYMVIRKVNYSEIYTEAQEEQRKKLLIEEWNQKNILMKNSVIG